MSTNAQSINTRSISLILWLILLPLILSACQLPSIVPPPQPTPSATPSPTTFSYTLRVQNADNDQQLSNAEAVLYFAGRAPMTETSDSNGTVRFILPDELQDSKADLEVNANGYLPQEQTVNLYTGQLPDTIQLEPLPFSTQFDFEPGKADETLVLIADFVDPTGIDSALVTQVIGGQVQSTQIVSGEVEANLDGYENIRIEYLDQIIPAKDGSDIAMQIGELLTATMVIWGNYAFVNGDPEVHVHFDILKQEITGFYSPYGPRQISQASASLEPEMFDFKFRLGDYLGEMVAFTAALILLQERQHQEAVPFFDTAAQAIGQPLADQMERWIQFYRGSNYLALGRALEAQSDLLGLAPELNVINVPEPDPMILPLHIAIGVIYTDLMNKEAALDYYRQAQLISLLDYNKTNQAYNKASQATILNNMGFVHQIWGDEEEALYYYEAALPILRSTGNRVNEARTLGNIGSIYHQLGDNQAAFSHFEDALSIGDENTKATMLNNIGGLYRDIGDIKEALSYYEASLTILEALGNMAKEAITLSNIGGVYLELKNNEDALDSFKQALSISQEIGDKFVEFGILSNLGDVYSNLGDREEALNHYRRALDISITTQTPDRELLQRQKIALLHIQHGERELVLEQFREMVNLSEYLNDHELAQLQLIFLMLEGLQEEAEE